MDAVAALAPGRGLIAAACTALGVSRASMKPIYRDDAFVPRMILPLSLSYDHRVVDGANGARFTSYLAKTLVDAHALTEAVP